MNPDAQSSPLMPERTHDEASATQVSAPGILWNCTSHVQGSEQIHGLGGPWECVEAPGREIDDGASHGSDEEDDDMASLPEADDFHPLEPSKREKDVYGTGYAAETYDRWLVIAAETICSEQDPRAVQPYRDLARSYKLLPKLERQVLIYDIETSSVEVRETLSQNFVLLLLSLGDHHSENMQIHLKSNREGLIARLVHALRLPSLPQRPKDDEVQTTSLVRALLEMSGGRVECQQHEHSNSPTTDKNAELLASVFDVTPVRGFTNADVHETAILVSRSSVFSQTNPQDLHHRTMMIRQFLRLGCEEGHLNLPPQTVVRFVAEQVNRFHCYLSHTYRAIPALNSPPNHQLLLLTWATKLSSVNHAASRLQHDMIQDWVRSDNGLTLYNGMVRRVQDAQSVQQLALIIAAMLSYSRFVPDNFDRSSQPFTGSYLADLDNQFGGYVLGNRGSVVGRMAFALIRVLLTLGDEYERLTTFLVATVNRRPPVLHALDGLSDQYFNFRVRGYDHESAFHIATTEASLSLPEPHLIRLTQTADESYETRVIDDTLLTEFPSIFSPVANRILEPPHFPPDSYKLVRLSQVEEDEVTDFFYSNAGEVREVPSVEAVGDGSYEIVVLVSHCDMLRDRINASLPNSVLELDYDPAQPTAADLQIFGDAERARKLRQKWFFQRAIRVMAQGWSPAAAYYARRLELLCSPKMVTERY